ncbi:hypothetical protein A3D71_01010 [Candidatus Kaiserbacteria bacterium RIFCSPHIGHO2_02_FULL_55_20]|uniref:Uncharacterized protein n=1 Tax=Candidatus Kaiserbacteria bacterium RIFCSPHIGHO2_02_FULL_55_20 TaxID=1798497 RepID=A0A1F6DVL5_9BACT|nr:MAG: hypothetical protein A2680_02720 [Candidatus Kaiserbacteria bacterium RIFCSPHIGHO2_01_FULL_55_37]OGG65485.1 MAG: hypothetical protein A3D71_01010 [Candidatus Kaiserbacteria bacterium RIFCSPHIGHO2_02_FULL_55_20]
MALSRFALALVLLAAPTVASAAAPRTFLDLSNVVVVILNNATAVLVVAGIVVYFYGVSTNILNFSDEAGEKLKAYFFWGIIVLFVMVSIWGILRLLQNTIFGGSSANPTTGSSVQNTSSDPFNAPRFGGE